MIRLEVNALCQKGLVRELNEDMVSLGGVLLRDDEMSFSVELQEDSHFCLLVSDGMGGHEHGERASQELLEYLGVCFKEVVFPADAFEIELQNHVRLFSDEMNRCSMAENQQHPMGCTLTGVVWANGKAYLINAGDSRTYRYRNGILRQLTVDETARGITNEPSESKLLLNCIGGGLEARLTVEDISDRLLDGDLLLLCSDGLSDMVTDTDIEETLSQSQRPVAELYEKACENGGFDNVSVILAKVVASQSPVS